MVTSYGLDSYGNVSSVTNALGQTLGLSGYVEGNGTPTLLDFNRAFTISRTATWEGWIQTEKDGRGYTTTYTYDPIGRVTLVEPPVGNATSYDYDNTAGAWVRRARDAFSETSQLDGLGRVVLTSNSEGIQTSVRYDSMGNVWFKSYPWDASTGEVGENDVFDGLGRATVVTKAFRPETGSCDTPGACRVTRTFLPNCASETVERGVADTLTTLQCNGSYGDPDERHLAQVLDANGNVWEYDYSAYGKLTSVTAPLAQGDRSYAYDEKQFLVSDWGPETGTTSYGRNAIGQMITRKDARPVTARFGYDDPLTALIT